MTTVHDRCGTTFMFIVMLVSVVIFSIVGIFEPYMKGLGAWKNVILFALAEYPIYIALIHAFEHGLYLVAYFFIRFFGVKSKAIGSRKTERDRQQRRR